MIKLNKVTNNDIKFPKKQKKSLEAKTFGNFTLLYHNKVIKFSRSKSLEFLAGDPQAQKSFAGEFMNQYSWAEDTAGFLEKMVLKK